MSFFVLDDFRVYMESTVVNIHYIQYAVLHKKRMHRSVVTETVSNTDFHFEKSFTAQKYEKVTLNVYANAT